MGLTFAISCIPPTASHHRKRIVRIGGFARLADKPELVAAKATLDALLLPHQPSQPVAGPVWIAWERGIQDELPLAELDALEAAYRAAQQENHHG